MWSYYHQKHNLFLIKIYFVWNSFFLMLKKMTFITALPQYLLEYHLKKNKFNLPGHFIVTCSILNDFLKLIMDEMTLPIIWKMEMAF